MRSRLAALLAVASILVATATGLTKYDRRHTQFYWNALYTSSFYSSWAETLETLASCWTEFLRPRTEIAG